MRKPTIKQQALIDSIPTGDPKRRAWIKYQLELNNYNLSSLAREEGLSRHSTKLALSKPYPSMEKLISEKIGLPHPMHLWPERYNTDGTTNRTRGRPKKNK